MSDRPFTHPNFGNEVHLEQRGTEVHLIFIAKTKAQADSMFDGMLRQLKAGAFNLTLMGVPTNLRGGS